MPKAIILKPPVSDLERGVLHVAFEDQWLRLLRSNHAAEIARQYDLILGPSWSLPPDLPMLLAGMTKAEESKYFDVVGLLSCPVPMQSGRCCATERWFGLVPEGSAVFEEKKGVNQFPVCTRVMPVTLQPP